MTNINDFIIKLLPDGSLAIRCAFCEGSGVFPETPIDDFIQNEPCSVCEGKGFNVFTSTIDNIIECCFCSGDGTGWDDNGYFLGEVCPVCGGNGFNLINDDLGEDLPYWSLIHPDIAVVSKKRFDDGHFADAVEAAFKEINTKVKKIVKQETGKELDGVSLMQHAFSLSNPIIKLDDLRTETGKNVQKGYMQIFSGAMTGIRNPKTHENQEISKIDAIHRIVLASLLMSKIYELGT